MLYLLFIVIWLNKNISLKWYILFCNFYFSEKIQKIKNIINK